jgi:hypothetical protein
MRANGAAIGGVPRRRPIVLHPQVEDALMRRRYVLFFQLFNRITEAQVGATWARRVCMPVSMAVVPTFAPPSPLHPPPPP